MSCKVELDDNTYRLVSPNGVEGEPAEYGDTAFALDGNRCYYSTINDAPDEGDYDRINVFVGNVEPVIEVAPVISQEDLETSDVCIDCTCRIAGAFKADFEVVEVSGLDDDDDEGPDDDDDGEALEEEEEVEDQEAVA